MKSHLQAIPLVTIMVVGSSSFAEAAETANNWYVSPMLSYIKADNDRMADDDFGLMLGVGKQVNERWNVELSAAVDNLGFEAASGEYKQRGLIVDGLYFFDRQAGMQTYAVVGAGVMKTDTGFSDSTNTLINAGLGVMKDITDQGMKVRADIRYRMDLDDTSVPSENKFNDVMLNLGLSIPFGDEKKSQPAKVAAVVNTNKDTDNDGVYDAVDQCANTSNGVQVDKNGCEIVQKIKEPVAAVVVDADKDGVVDSQDQCLDTASNVKVDNKGCEIQKSFVLKGVNFVTGSDVLTEQSKQVLKDVAKTLMMNPELQVEIAGYTDNVGNHALNAKLSQKRAESVKAYVVASGASASQLAAKGYGDANPIASNATADGRTQNRRVELHVVQ